MIEVKEVKVAYVVGGVSSEIVDEMTDIEATMYNNDGGGQYSLETLRDRFDDECDEFADLDSLIKQGYNYIEYS